MIEVRLFMIVLETIHALVHVCILPTTLRVVHQGMTLAITNVWLLECVFKWLDLTEVYWVSLAPKDYDRIMIVDGPWSGLELMKSC